MNTPRQGRGTNAYRLLCARQRALGLPCWICGHPIDYHAPPRTRWSFSLDHHVPLTFGGRLLDPDNARSAHYSCNSRRGSQMREAANAEVFRQTSLNPSRDW